MLLIERMSFTQAHVEVETDESLDSTGRKNLYMKGIFIQGGIRNLNERVYPVEEIRKAVDSINAKIANGFSITGELDHPDTLTISLERIALSIESMWMDGNNGCGKLKIIPTPMGQIARTLIENSVKLGISSRGSGNVLSNGTVDSFEMITCDLVQNSSAPQAYPVPMYESLSSRRGRIIEDLAQSVSHDPRAQKHLTRELLKYINNLKF